MAGYRSNNLGDNKAWCEDYWNSHGATYMRDHSLIQKHHKKKKKNIFSEIFESGESSIGGLTDSRGFECV